MRVPAALLIAATLLAGGCASFRPKDRDRDTDNRRPPENRDPNAPWWLEGADTPTGRTKGKTKTPADSASRLDRETIIAGEIVDARDNHRLRGKTFIVVRPADEVLPAGSKGNYGVETDEDGYFFAPGLTPGKTYILSAVREVDGRKVAAEMQVKPPAANIRLELGADKVSSITPAMPPPTGLGPFEPRAEANIRPPALPDPPDLAPPVHRENIAGTTSSQPPTAAIRPPPEPAPESRKEEPPTARIPGQKVPNFLVTDLTGSEWEFRYAAGRLILVDFWSTTCGPCLRAVPAMKKLQANYGQSGLEIVAIACEANDTLARRSREVEEVSRKKEMNYRVYLERENRVGEVQKLFQVQWVPTLVLLERNGTILWRGGATETELARLDEVVKEYLTRR